MVKYGRPHLLLPVCTAELTGSLDKQDFFSQQRAVGQMTGPVFRDAVTRATASTSAQPKVEQQLQQPLQTLTLSEETPSLTMILRVIM